MAREVENIPIGPIYTGGPCRGMVHVIENGDTLYNLGKKYHVSVTQLMFANPYVNVYNLQVGDELCIPTRLRQRGEEMEDEREEGNL
ncbi:LysM peptidoglycan-binding domain-containing protein [Roseburia sp. 499]|uniref:LysM peptidoglycan-binding domain-containing protein n=1 Tax=Roseburia sp. 499 TaxID=1261634 RepID=UPI0009519882|nr:LysM domain-containing protein [Roseburia sp. 499]WVK68549.1 LysM domain-containing protein [Roseburia sp. 499]